MGARGFVLEWSIVRLPLADNRFVCGCHQDHFSEASYVNGQTLAVDGGFTTTGLQVKNM